LKMSLHMNCKCPNQFCSTEETLSDFTSRKLAVNAGVNYI
jgi:hypothetical protein